METSKSLFPFVFFSPFFLPHPSSFIKVKNTTETHLILLVDLSLSMLKASEQFGQDKFKEKLVTFLERQNQGNLHAEISVAGFGLGSSLSEYRYIDFFQHQNGRYKMNPESFISCPLSEACEMLREPMKELPDFPGVTHLPRCLQCLLSYVSAHFGGKRKPVVLVFSDFGLSSVSLKDTRTLFLQLRDRAIVIPVLLQVSSCLLVFSSLLLPLFSAPLLSFFLGWIL